ncbi:MAG: hypothetical protein ACRDH7_12775 [Actinomycetota bacterium]
MDTDIDRLLTEEEAGWIGLLAALEAVPVERWEEPTVTPDGWSPKDLMYHVAAWCAECDTHLEQMRTDTLVEDGLDTDERNRRFFEVSKGMDVSSTRAELLASRTRMREALQKLGTITPDSEEWFQESGAIHYADHVGHLSAWQGRA